MPSHSPDAAARRDLWLLLALFAAAFCLNLLIPRDLWVQDEARYGEVVREMLTTGRWMVPHLNGFPYPDKPALYFWLVAAVGGVVGQGAMAFRLLTIASTLGALAGVYLTGSMLGGRRAGVWSTAIFATTFLTLFVGQIARMDMLLTATTVFAWYSLLRFHRDGSAGALLGFWTLVVLGVAIKGPIALLFSLLPGLAWLGWERGWAGLRAMRLGLGLLVFAAVVLAWIALVIAHGEADYLRSIWHDQLVGRTIKSWSHREPFYFYFLLLPLLAMPWSGPIIAGLYRQWREHPPYWRAALLFSLLPLFAVSLVSGKLFIYIEPLFPAIAIVGGRVAAALPPQARVTAWYSLPPVLFLLACAAAVAWVTQTYLHGAPAGYAIGVGLTVLALAGLALAFLSARRWLPGWTVLSTALSVLFFGAFVYLLNPLYSARAIGEAITRLAKPDQPVGVVNTTRGILNYYAGRRMTELEIDQARPWWAAHPDALMIIKTEDAAQIMGSTHAFDACRIHQTYSVELKEYQLVEGCPQP